MTDEFLSIDEAAALIGRHRVTLDRRVQRGELTAYRVGDDRRKNYVRRSDIERLGAPTPIVRKQETRAATSATAA